MTSNYGVIPRRDLSSTFIESRERRLKLLEERKCRYEEYEHCEFTADEALIGLIIGKQGEKLTRVAREHKVEIRVLPDDCGSRRVRIYGADMSTVVKARAVLEYIYQAFDLSEIITNLNAEERTQSLKELSQQTNLHCTWFDASTNTAVLCGLRRSIEHATHLLYIESERMNESLTNPNQSFNEERKVSQIAAAFKDVGDNSLTQRYPPPIDTSDYQRKYINNESELSHNRVPYSRPIKTASHCYPNHNLSHNVFYDNMDGSRMNSFPDYDDSIPLPSRVDSHFRRHESYETTQHYPTSYFNNSSLMYQNGEIRNRHNHHYPTSSTIHGYNQIYSNMFNRMYFGRNKMELDSFDQ